MLKKKKKGIKYNKVEQWIYRQNIEGEESRFLEKGSPQGISTAQIGTDST